MKHKNFPGHTSHNASQVGVYLCGVGKVFIFNLTLCVPCIILQCVNDQQDIQFL